jgi:hypothetical protein
MSNPTAPPPRVHDANALPVGTRLGEFELLSLLGVGGFGIVYLAFDHALEREVAVKEYMPASLAGRTETMHVSLRSQSDTETFALGLRSFVNEARLLARFDHPSLLKVLRFWEANGTAYMAMPVMRGRTLKELRTELGRAPDEEVLRSMLGALLGALDRLHGEGVYHRDIAPDNIQVEPDGKPVLLDFGAARRVLSDKTQTLTAILKPAYAPIEQYAETGSVKQGPWTDFYALGATLHYVLLGKPPAPATARAVFDESSALAGQGLPGYSTAFLQMVDWMLAPRPNDRPQSVAELRQVLLGERQVPAPYLVEPSGDAWDKTQVLPHGLTAGDDATLVMPRTGAAAHGHRPPASTVAPGMPYAPATPHAATTTAPSAAPARASASVPVPAPLSSMVAAEPAPVAAMAPAAPASAAAAAPAAPRRSSWAIAAAVAAVVAVAGFVFWPKPASLPAPSLTAAPAAVSPAVLSAAPAVVADAAVPASTPLATVVTPNPSAGAGTAAALQAPTPAQPPVPSATPATLPAAALARARPESDIKPVQTVSTRAAQRPATNPQVAPATGTAGPGAGAAPYETSAVGSASVPGAPVAAAPGNTAGGSAGGSSGNNPTAAVAGGPAARAQPTAAEPVAGAAVAGPEAKCAGRNPLSYFVCMERECLRSSFSGHADCQAWRKSAKRE